MESIYKYPVTLTKDDNGTLLVTFPDFPDAITFGDDEKDALFHAENALTEVIHARIEDNEEIPAPSKGKYFAYLPPVVAAKVALYNTMKEEHIKKATLAKRLDCNQKQIDRLLDVNHNSTIKELSKAYAACNMRLIISTEKDEKVTKKRSTARRRRPVPKKMAAKR